jgi:hypothetical protein
MTEERNDGKKWTVEDAVRLVTDHLAPSNPAGENLFIFTLYDLLVGSVAALRHHAEKDPTVWKNGLLQLDYEIEAEKAKMILMGEDAEDTEDVDLVVKKSEFRKLVRALVKYVTDPDVLYPLAMHIITHGIVIYVTEEGCQIELPDELDAAVEALPKDQQEDRLKELSAGVDLSESFDITMDTPAGKESFTGTLVFTIYPLTFDTKELRAFFPVVVGLDLEGISDPAAWPEEDQKGFWDAIIEGLKKAAEDFIQEAIKGQERPAVPEPDRAVPVRAEYFKAPGRLFDTPRHAEAHDMLPAIRRWYSQTAFNRTVAMAAAALTKTKTREAIFDWQSATVAEVEDLVYCRSEEGTPAHGQHREDILKAFEALRAIPIPIVRIDWKQIGTDRNPRWVKQYKIRIASLLQSYGAIFADRRTGKTVYHGDPELKKEKVKGRPDRRKKLKELVAQNFTDGILECFPPDRYVLTGFEWRWNTDVCEDFICPHVALDEKDRPRRKLKGGRHPEGSRFINLNRRYFAIMKHLRDRGSKYGPRLLDLLVSEKRYISDRGKGFVWIEIAADKVIKRLDLWGEYQNRPKHVLEEHVAAAIMELIREKVMLHESWLVPQLDKNPDRRKSEYYRWKIAELWSTVALVPPEEAKEVEDAIVAEAEAKAEAARSQPVQLDKPADQDQGVLWEEPPRKQIPDGKTVRAAREAAGLNLRDFARTIDGPDFSTWSRYESGKPIRTGKIPEAVWDRVRAFVEKHGPKDGSEGN